MPDWTGASSCVDEDPELFFPRGGGFRFQPQINRARQICHRCPVRERCLDFALENRVEYGIWGGTTPEQRRELDAGPRTLHTRRFLVVGRPRRHLDPLF